MYWLMSPSALPPMSLAYGIPYSGMVPFRVRGSARSAEVLLPGLKLFTLAESLGNMESLAELPHR
ncbi:hypothetical protein EDB19DRAFT_1731686 [Suillus lakei]|nr:hypothetical protein EDB19DRAFT_1731686 [Suillus lakei]